MNRVCVCAVCVICVRVYVMIRVMMSILVVKLPITFLVFMKSEMVLLCMFNLTKFLHAFPPGM